MVDWKKQLSFEEVEIGKEIPPVSIPITLQRLVMEAGANRDFSPIHYDGEIAQATGAPDAYANTFFILAMFERSLREWAGLRGTIRKIGPFRMKMFNCVDDVMTYKGKVKDKYQENGNNIVKLDIWCETHKGQTVTGEAIVMLPRKG